MKLNDPDGNLLATIRMPNPQSNEWRYVVEWEPWHPDLTTPTGNGIKTVHKTLDTALYRAVQTIKKLGPDTN